jgi:hypothetical protein
MLLPFEVRYGTGSYLASLLGQDLSTGSAICHPSTLLNWIRADPLAKL